MANNIERDIVQMVFDAKQFRKGIQGSIEDIEQLKKSFDFVKAQQSLGELGKASQTDFSPMAASLDAINSKLSIVGIAAATFVSRITNSVIDSAKKMADALILDPIKTGLEEYETQLNAVQTILANTAKDGTSLGDVNRALDELNEYADLTIYNFTQMTDSIGKFTTAGVDLDTSVAAIKGIANVAAVSGANAESASRAMYQLSQAISSGIVRLQDWMSVENAGLGGAVFKDSLIETAKLHGVAVDEMIEKNGSFRNSLQEGWLSADIMLQTLEKFTGDMTEAQLLSLGYTEQQAANILKVAETANDAATKIKTLTQLKDTMAEALQSGWGQTWRIIFGDFEEAKELWGGIANVFGGIIDNSADARNSLLEMWKEFGGRVALIKTLYNLFDAISTILIAVGQGFREVFAPLTAVDLFQVTFNLMRFSESLKELSREAIQPVKKIATALAAALDIIKMAFQAILAPIGRFIRTLAPASGGFLDFILMIADAIISFREFAIETDFFNAVVEAVLSKIDKFIAKIAEVIDRLKEFEIVQDVIKWIGGLTKDDFIAVWNGILTVIAGVIGAFSLLSIGAKKLYTSISKLSVISKLGDWFSSISWGGIKSGFGETSSSATSFFDSFKNSELFTKFVTYLKTFDGRRLEEFFSAAREHFSWISDILDTIKDKLFGVGDASKGAGKSVEGIGVLIEEKLGSALDFLINNAQNIDYNKIFDRLFQVLNAGILFAIAGGIKSLATGGWLENALQSIGFGEPEKIGKSIASMFGSVEGVMTQFQNNLKADTLQKIAIAIAVLAGSIFLITLIDSTKLLAATGAIAAMVALLFGASGALSKINATDTMSAAASLIGMAIAITIMAKGLSILAGIAPERIESSLLSMTAGLAALVASIVGLSKGNDAGLIKIVGTILGIAGSLRLLVTVVEKFGALDPGILAQGLRATAISLAIVTSSLVALTRLGTKGTLAASVALLDVASGLTVLVGAVSKFGNLDPEVLKQGLISIAAIVAGFAGFSRLLDPKGLLLASVAFIVMTGALNLMFGVVESFGGLSWDEILRGLVGLGGALLMLVVAANAMTGAIVGAGAMLVMSVAVTALAVALNLLGQLSWEQLGIALAGLAASLVILGVGALLLTPLVPVLIALGIAFLLMGSAAMLLGVGLLAASAGMVAIAGSAALLGGGLKIIGAAFIELLPQLGEALAQGFINFLTVIGDNTPKIIKAMGNIILGMIEGTVAMIPQIVEVIFIMMGKLLDAIVEHLPQMIDKGWKILKAFLQGIVDHIQDVVEMGITIVTEIINGIAESIPELIDAAFNLLVEFLGGIEAAIDEYMPDIISAGTRIGVALVKGMVEGLWDSIDILLTAIKDLIQMAIDRIKAEWKVTSPSEVTRNISHQIMYGFAFGIRDKMNAVFAALTEFSRKAQNGIDPIKDALDFALEDTMDFNPVITPVLNLDGIKTGVRDMNRTLGRSTMLAGGIYSDEQDYNTGPTTNQGYADGGERIQLVQNNYSPKALDPAEIFRRTETQMAKLALIQGK